MASRWRHVGSTSAGGVVIRMEYNDEDKIYRARVDVDPEAPIEEVGTYSTHAKHRLAEKLEICARALRNG